jgi:hypothetical protein
VVWDLKKQRPVITLKDPNRCAGHYSCQQRRSQPVQLAQESIRLTVDGPAASISQLWMLQLGSTIAAVPSHTRSCMIPVQQPVRAELSSSVPGCAMLLVFAVSGGAQCCSGTPTLLLS